MTERKAICMVEAINLALHRAMADDPGVVVLGEDVGPNGGVFRATVGLHERFGFRRVMDTPLAETLITGIAVGMAAQGLKPVAEIQFMGFIYAGMEHLVSHASRLRSRTRGRLSCPMVMRTPHGGGIMDPNITGEGPERWWPTFPACAVGCPHRHGGPMVCCWLPLPIRTR